MESKRLVEIKNYQKKLKKLLNKDLIDIVIFGSFVKNGSANDIDIALISKDKKDFEEKKKEIKEIIGPRLDFEIIDINSLYSGMILTLIKEGFSVKRNKFIYEINNIKPSILYKYSLKKLSNVQKVQFERGIKNVIGKKGVFLTRSVIMIPMSIKGEMDDFLKTWNIFYESRDYELLPLLRNESLF